MKLTFLGCGRRCHRVDAPGGIGGKRDSCWIAACTRDAAKMPIARIATCRSPGRPSMPWCSPTPISTTAATSRRWSRTDSRPDLHHARHHRPVQLDAARHRAHPGKGRRVPEQAPGAPQGTRRRRTDSSSRSTPWRTPSDPAAVPAGAVITRRSSLTPSSATRAYDAGHILGSSSVVLHEARAAARCGWLSRATWAGRTCPSSATRSRCRRPTT